MKNTLVLTMENIPHNVSESERWDVNQQHLANIKNTYTVDDRAEVLDMSLPKDILQPFENHLEKGE